MIIFSKIYKQFIEEKEYPTILSSIVGSRDKDRHFDGVGCVKSSLLSNLSVVRFYNFSHF